MAPDDKVSARFTTRFRDRTSPVFSGRPRKMTARAALAEYRDLKRGGTFVGADVRNELGVAVRISDLEFDAEEWPRGPGRPVTTRSDSTPTVNYRVSAEQRAELDREATRLGLASANEAAKRRAFPVS